MVDILYDGPAALVTDRVLVIRTRPPQTLWTNRINRPCVVPEPLSPTRAGLTHALGATALLVLAIWPATRRPEAFLIGAIVVAVSAFALAAARRKQPRYYTLCCIYEDKCVELLAATDRNELVRIARAIQDAAADNPGDDITDAGT
jgi:hypothetical protein